jgi:hypothetical protein
VIALSITPGQWFGWVLIGAVAVVVFLLLFLLALGKASASGDRTVDAMFAQHDPATGVPSAPVAADDLEAMWEASGVEDAASLRTVLYDDEADQ